MSSLQDYKRNQKTVPADGTVFWLLGNGGCSRTLNPTMNRLEIIWFNFCLVIQG
ncbi:hypothetical protein [Bacillus sp. K2I17]|uniref:hypothetical protein n=1 Tax=Bacillus sp. K2I17 TaxID=2014743 RepID=UPI0015C623C7|nr:hypothetical protein [Bacillus sp. K2I17]